jgi:hypothetical protein
MGKRIKQAAPKIRGTNGQQIAIKEIQIKITPRCHLLLVTMAVIKNNNNNKCWPG